MAEVTPIINEDAFRNGVVNNPEPTKTWDWTIPLGNMKTLALQAQTKIQED